MKIIVGSRGSKLALKQTEYVINKLKKAYPDNEYEIKVIHTIGDKMQHVALDKINDKGVFVKEIEKELLEHTIDLAVHSLKDMPSDNPAGLVYAKTLAPSDYRDCLVLKNCPSLAQLPFQATVATGSKRRKFQLLKLRPDLKIIDIRGNVNTRLKKMEEQDIDGLVLASAGLKRLKLKHLISEYFDETRMIPACGQGILALQVRQNSEILTMINDISDEAATTRMKLERLFLKSVNGSCHIPVGAYAKIKDKEVHFYGLLGNEEGTILKSNNKVFNIADANKEVIKLAQELMRQVYER